MTKKTIDTLYVVLIAIIFIIVLLAYCTGPLSKAEGEPDTGASLPDVAPDGSIYDDAAMQAVFDEATKDRSHREEALMTDSYNDTVTCYRCGATNKTLVGGSSWRWTGEHWIHRCSGLYSYSRRSARR